MRNLTKYIVLGLFLVLSCSDDEESRETETEKSSAKAILSFSFESSKNTELENDIQAVINEGKRTISAELPYGINLENLVPTISISELATISPNGPQNFNSSVAYTVTAEDGSSADYTVTVDFESATLISMNPESGPKNTLVTFVGNNFGKDISNVKVFFDEIEAEVQEVNQSEIKALVPPRAFTGIIRILIGDQELDGLVFNYEISDVQVSILTGSGQGFLDGQPAQFSFPEDITIDEDGDLYVTDSFNHSIRKITFQYEEGLLAGIEVSTLAGNGNSGFVDGIGNNAQFDTPLGITIDLEKNLYVSDTGNNSIRKITTSGEVNTFIGQGDSNLEEVVGSGSFFDPRGIFIDDDSVYVIDGSNHSIRRIVLSGDVTTLAGIGMSGFVDGTTAEAMFSFPKDIVVDSDGNFYITDSNNNSIRKITSTGMVSTLAGNGVAGFEDGDGSSATFNFPQGITIDDNDNLYVVDVGNHSIRKITPSGIVTTIAGNGTQGFTDGQGSEAQFNQPRGITIDKRGNLYVVDRGNHSIRLITQE